MASSGPKRIRKLHEEEDGTRMIAYWSVCGFVTHPLNESQTTVAVSHQPT